MVFFGPILLLTLAAPTDTPISSEEVDLSEPMAPAGNPGRWATNDDYPPAAAREQREGTSGFLLTIDANGVPTDCTITSSSGSADLDQTTCHLLLARARFTPGRDKAGRPTGGTYSNRIRWQIPQDIESAQSEGFQVGSFDGVFPRPPYPTSETMALSQKDHYPAAALTHGDEGMVRMALTISPTGKVTDCTISESSHSDALDQASCGLMRAKAIFTPALNSKGEPTTGAFAANFNWILPEQPDVDDGKLADALSKLPPRLPAFPMADPGKTVLTLTVKADGSVGDCHFEGEGSFSSPTKGLDPCTFFMAKTRYAPFLGKDGKPEARHFVLRTDLSVDHVEAKAPVGGN